MRSVRGLSHCLNIGMVVGLLLAWSKVASAAEPKGIVGDRLVIAINNIPYSQRQLEVYIAVKESLRRAPRKMGARLVTAENWQEALKVFSDDMLILQEAIRLGSFLSTDQNFDKYERIVRERFKDDADLQKATVRLGIDGLTIAKTLETVLRIAAFRRSKDRQAQLGNQVENKDDELAAEAPGKVAAHWFTDLEERAVERQYQGAGQYLLIEPNAGQKH